MSVHQRSSFRRVPTEGRDFRPGFPLRGLVAAILILATVRLAAAEDKPVVTIRPAPPRSSRPAPPAPAPRVSVPAPAAPASHPQQAAAPQRRPRRRAAAARVPRRTRRAAEPRAAAAPAPRQPERRVRTAARTDRNRFATRRPEPVRPAADATLAPRESPRVAAAPRRRVRTRVAGYRATRSAEDVRAADNTAAAPRRHSRRIQVASRSRQEAPADTGSGMGAVGLNSVGFRLIRQGRYADAEPYLRRAVAQDPNFAYAQYNLGWSLLAQGKAAQALGPLQHSAAQQPERWEPQEKLAEAYRRLADGDRASAAAARAKHLRRHRQSGQAFPSVGRTVAKAVPVRSAVDGGSWRGSTDRKEERYLTEWRAMR